MIVEHIVIDYRTTLSHIFRSCHVLEAPLNQVSEVGDLSETEQ